MKNKRKCALKVFFLLSPLNYCVFSNIIILEAHTLKCYNRVQRPIKPLSSVTDLHFPCINEHYED